MVNPAQDWPDFTRATLLVGVDAAGDPIGVLVDSDGNLSALLKGETALGALKALRVDDDGQMIMIPCGATGNYLNVDASGFLTAVLKGAFAGDLHTIAVDVNGRIEAFVLDGESQWGQVLKVGNADLASRLGSSQSWDWRGNQIYYNDFGQGTGNVLRYYNGLGSGIALDPALWVNGGFSLKMTGGSNGDGDAYIDVMIDRPPSKQMGLEVHFSGDPSFEYVYARLEYRYSYLAYRAGLRVTVDGFPDVAYLDSEDVWQDIGASYPGIAAENFNHLKIVADFGTGKYMRAMWGHTEFDLSAFALRGEELGWLDQITARFYVKSTAGKNEFRYLDYLRVTVGEPA